MEFPNGRCSRSKKIARDKVRPHDAEQHEPIFKSANCLFDNVFQTLRAQLCIAVLSKSIVAKEWATQSHRLVNGCCFCLMEQGLKISDFM